MNMHYEMMDQYMNLVIFFSLLLVFIVFKSLLSPSHVAKLPPSPWRFPVLGNLHQLGQSQHRSLAALSDKYGPLMLLKFGQTPVLVVSCPEIVKEIVKTHDIIFSDRSRTTATDILFYEGRDLVFSSYGVFWREIRKICTIQLLSLKRVQSFIPVREEEVSKMLGTIRRASGPVNLSDILVSTSNNIMSRCVLGRRYGAEENGGKKLEELLDSIVVDVAVSIGDLFPGLRWVDVVRGFIGRLKSNSRALDKLYTNVIQEHKAMMSSDNEVKDFVDVLLQLDFHSITDVAGLTHEQYVKTVIQNMLLAGIETSSTSTNWTMAELLRNPRVMKKAQEEIRGVVGNKGRVEPDDIDRMEYLRCVFKESLRLHPPVPLLVPRQTSEDVQIRGYTIPAKTRVLVNSWAIQRDPRWWDQPEEFFPERFENSSVDFKSQESFQLIPFGFGRRICPGMTFGKVNVEYVLANLLYWFDWKLLTDSPEEFDMTESFGITVRKRNPIYAIPIHYSP